MVFAELLYMGGFVDGFGEVPDLEVLALIDCEELTISCCKFYSLILILSPRSSLVSYCFTRDY